MVSKVLYSLVCVLCGILYSVVWADDCGGYKDKDGLYHEPLQCGSQYCCGDENRIYCCSKEESRFTREIKESRVERSTAHNFFPFLGTIVAPVGSCVAIIICCVCIINKKCRKRRNQKQQDMIMTTVNTTQVALLPSGYQLSHPGQQPLLDLHGHGGPASPTAPPLYLEATAHPPAPQGQLMHPPGQNCIPPPLSDEHVQLPYNPTYVPNS